MPVAPGLQNWAGRTGYRADRRLAYSRLSRDALQNGRDLEKTERRLQWWNPRDGFSATYGPGINQASDRLIDAVDIDHAHPIIQRDIDPAAS